MLHCLCYEGKVRDSRRSYDCWKYDALLSAQYLNRPQVDTRAHGFRGIVGFSTDETIVSPVHHAFLFTLD